MGEGRGHVGKQVGLGKDSLIMTPQALKGLSQDDECSRPAEKLGREDAGLSLCFRFQAQMVDEYLGQAGVCVASNGGGSVTRDTTGRVESPLRN